MNLNRYFHPQNLVAMGRVIGQWLYRTMSDYEMSHGKWLRRFPSLALMVGMSALVFTGCGVQSRNASDYELAGAAFDAGYLELVKTNSGIVLPSDSQGQNLLWRGRQIDPSFLAKIVITTNSVDSFIKQVRQLRNQTVSVSGSTTPGVIWWQPSKGSVAVERTFAQDGCYVHAIVCQENGVWYLYLEWVSV